MHYLPAAKRLHIKNNNNVPGWLEVANSDLSALVCNQWLMTMNIRDLHVICTYKRTRQWWLNNDDDFWMQNVRLFLDLTKLQLNPGGNLCSPGPTHRSRHQRLSFYSRTIVQWRGVASFLTSCRPGWLSFPHILPWKLHAWLVRTDLTNTLSLFSSPQQRIIYYKG